MNTAVIAFTLKGQDFYLIEKHIKRLSNDLSQRTILIHGFMPRKAVVERGWSVEVVDALQHYFPIQLCMHDGEKVLRDEMAEIAEKLGAAVYVIGDIKEGVKEEVLLYEQKGLEIIPIPLYEETGHPIV